MRTTNAQKEAGYTRVELFVNYYVEGVLTGKPSAMEAQVRAGYSARSNAGWKILQREDVKAYIAKVCMARARELEITGTRTVAEIASIAYSPVIPGYISAGEKVKALKHLGDYQKLFEGSKGDKVIVINVLPQDEKTL